ncbi:hypothetical protein [Methylopila sp. Yamaguchi]|uniref:hypothetical protein n=1 Tax=Methylopila sp. Yamaguchi TaxID=1437817 RepID=UPI000CC8AE20|nr:hypothetical protein [Methylopila sp. Yamaguchi]GBD47586.1 hypothetical protein METY_0799 [Methylopila sp. Yamaguchi]
MLYISYGAKKSGSTFTYLMTRDLCRAAGYSDPLIPAAARGNERRSDVNTVRDWSPEIVARLDGFVPRETIATLRTHVPATPAIAGLIARGRARHHVGIRDLRDIALSLTDVMARLSARGIDRGRSIRIGDISSTFVELTRNATAMTSWAEIPGALIVPYEEIAFNTHSWLAAICAHMQISVDPEGFEAIMAAARGSPNVKMNVAQPNRHRREMSAADQEAILAAFPDFYARFFPGASVEVEESDDVSKEGAAGAAPAAAAGRSEKRLAKRAQRRAEKRALRG